MGVKSEIAAPMIYDDHVAVPLEIIGEDHTPLVDGPDLRTGPGRYGDPFAEGIGVELGVFVLAERLDDRAPYRQRQASLLGGKSPVRHRRQLRQRLQPG